MYYHLDDRETFEVSVNIVADILFKSNARWWINPTKFILEARELENMLNISYSSARDFFTIMNGFSIGKVQRMDGFMKISRIIYDHMGFNSKVTTALVIWYAYMIFIPQHIEEFGIEPIDMLKVLNYAFEQGSFPTDMQ